MMSMLRIFAYAFQTEPQSQVRAPHGAAGQVCAGLSAQALVDGFPGVEVGLYPIYEVVFLRGGVSDSRGWKRLQAYGDWGNTG